MINFAKSVTQSWAEPIHQLRRELELPELAGNPLIDDKFSPYLVLAMFSSMLAKPQPDWAANTVVTGFAFYDDERNQAELTPELQQFLDIDEPPLVFTFLREQYSASRVAKELSELVRNPSYAAKAAKIGRTVQAENGVGVACDAVEKQLEGVAIIS